LNPVVSGLVSAPEDWSYSNYLEWAGKRGGTLWDRDLVQQYFPKPQDYEKFIHSSIENAMAAKIKRYLMD
jgi:cytochrome c2